MSEVTIEVVGGNSETLFGSDASEGSVHELDGVEVEYSQERVAKSIEGEAFEFVVHLGSDFAQYAGNTVLFEKLVEMSPKAIKVDGEGVETEEEAIKQRLDEAFDEID